MKLYSVTIPRERAACSSFYIKEDMRPMGGHVRHKLEEKLFDSGIEDNGGIYMMFNRVGEIIYIGQAKHFINRMGNHHKFNEYGLVREIDKIKFFGSEGGEIGNKKILDDLEAALIIKEQPRYNIALKNNDKVKNYIDKYATLMLEIADSELGNTGIDTWNGLDSLNSDYKTYKSFSSLFAFADICDCDTITSDQLRYADWWDSGVPTVDRLKECFEKKKIPVEMISKIWGIPVEHVKRKVFNQDYQKELNRVYGVGVVQVC